MGSIERKRDETCKITELKQESQVTDRSPLRVCRSGQETESRSSSEAISLWKEKVSAILCVESPFDILIHLTVLPKRIGKL
jgi:hypothetical protein